MSDAPEWVDEPENPEPARIDERQITIEGVTTAIEAALSSLMVAANMLLRLDEMGCAVSRSRTRVGKSVEVVQDLKAHFVYDVVEGKTAPTKDQKVRAERYDLS